MDPLSRRLASSVGKFLSVTPTASSFDTGDRTTYTFTGLSTGTADPARWIVVCVSGLDTGLTERTIASLTVGGSAATRIVRAYSPSTNQCISEIWYISAPTGTTADVVVTWSAGIIGCGVNIFSVVGASGILTTNTAVTAATLAASVYADATNVVIANVSEYENTSAVTTFTWSGGLTTYGYGDMNNGENAQSAYGYGNGSVSYSTLLSNYASGPSALAIAVLN